MRPSRACASSARARSLDSPGSSQSSSGSGARALAMSALEGLDDAHASEIALTALSESDVDVVVAALGVLRSWVPRESGTRLLESITAIAVDRSRDARIRVAALDALSDCPTIWCAPFASRPRRRRPAAATRQSCGGARMDRGVTATRPRWPRCTTRSRRSASRRVERTRAVAVTSGSKRAAPLTRCWPRAEADWPCTTPARRSAPRSLRCRPDSSKPLQRVGDASCLEPLARAWSATREAGWRAQLAEAARQIVARAKLGGRSAVVKGIRANWAGFI